MSETQYYKTVTFKNRVSITVESALICYILDQEESKRLVPGNAEHEELMNKNIARAEEALAAIRAAGVSEGMKL